MAEQFRSLLVVQVIQKSQGMAGEDVRRRREVGCQWEHPKEERKEVGCQSDATERRDASVQVDLLTQQLSWRHAGVAWQCVSVRADEPGGGALLQHCTLDTGQYIQPPLYLLCSPLTHTQLPTVPLFRPAAPPASKELQRTTLLPIMPQCDPLLPPADVSAPPPGLIAPLSPRLAEEDVEEMEEEGVELVKTKDVEQARRPRRTAGPPIRYLLESEEQSHGLSAANHSKIREAKVKMKLRRRKHQEREEAEDEDGLLKLERSESRPVKLKSVNTGQAAAQIQHTQADGGGNDMMKEEGGQKRRYYEEQRTDEEVKEEVKPLKTKEVAQTWRPRRTAGPPIRYLLESEDQSYGLSAANHSKVRGVKVEMKLGRKEREEDGLFEHVNKSGPVKLTSHITGRLELNTRRPDSSTHLKRKMDDYDGHHQGAIQSEERSSIRTVRSKTQRGETRLKSVTTGQAVAQIQHTPADGGGNNAMEEDEMIDQLLEDKGGSKRRYTLEQEKDEVLADEEEEQVKPLKTEVMEQVGGEKWRPRRTVGPPIRYLLESEVQSHGLSAANHSKVKAVKVELKLGQKEYHEEKRERLELTERTHTSRVESSEARGLELRQVCEKAFTSLSSLQHHLPILRAGHRCHICNKKFSCTNKLRLHYSQHHRAAGSKQDNFVNTTSDGQREKREKWTEEEEEKTLLPAYTKAPDWLGHIKYERRTPQWWVDYRTTMRRRRHDAERWRRRQEKDAGRWKKRRRCREEEEQGDRKLRNGEEEKQRETEAKKEVLDQPQTGHIIAGRQTGHIPADRQTGHIVADRQTGHIPADRQTGHIVAGRQTGHIPADRQTGHIVAGRQTGHIILDRQTDRIPTERQTCHVTADRQTGHIIADRQTGHVTTDRQTGSNRWVYLDRQSSQVTLLSPCCVRLQRLPLIG